MTVAGDFAAWALDLRLDDIPEDVQAAACRQLLDGIGCAVAAVRGDAAPYATSVATALGAAGRRWPVEGNVDLIASPSLIVHPTHRCARAHRSDLRWPASPLTLACRRLGTAVHATPA
jgi:hypothetical protein